MDIRTLGALSCILLGILLAGLGSLRSVLYIQRFALGELAWKKMVSAIGMVFLGVALFLFADGFSSEGDLTRSTLFALGVAGVLFVAMLVGLLQVRAYGRAYKHMEGEWPITVERLTRWLGSMRSRVRGHHMENPPEEDKDTDEG
jgi:hypothetical protein